MAVNQNWTRYEIDIGWKEVSASEVFSDTILLNLLNETITQTYLKNKLHQSYSNGVLDF